MISVFQDVLFDFNKIYTFLLLKKHTFLKQKLIQNKFNFEIF